MATTEQERIQKMIEAGMHIGVRRFSIHPKMKQFIFTFKEDLALINLSKSLELWDQTFAFLRDLVSKGKTVLFLGTHPAARVVIPSYGDELGFPYMTKRWLGGTLTNFSTFKARLERLKELEAKIASADFTKYTKKEQGQMIEEVKEIRDKFEGLVKLDDLPHALFVFCGKRHRTAVFEAKKKDIPIIGAFGLDDNPDDAKVFVPINDNSRLAVEMIMEQVKQIYLESKSVEQAIQNQKTDG